MKELVIQKIKEYDTIIIHGHKRPDGDCYGAQFGLKSLIANSFPEKKVYVVGETSEFVRFIGEMDVIEDSVYENALAFVVDTGNRDRVSDQRYLTAKEVFKIDHHIPVDQYGDYQWVDTNYPATSQMITHLLVENKDALSIDKFGAVALYTGIVTDTGRFRFRGVSENTMCMAGYLLNQGVDVEYIDNQLSVETLETLKLKGYVLTHFETTPNGVAYIKLDREIIESFGVTDEDAAAVVNLIGGIEGYPVWFLAIEYPQEIRLRIRSRGPNIDELANKYEGGGHAKASGAKLESWEHLSTFLHDIDAWVKTYKDSL